MSYYSDEAIGWLICGLHPGKGKSPSLLFNWHYEIYPRGEAAGARRGSLTSILCWGYAGV
jgi:hypothetical protein